MDEVYFARCPTDLALKLGARPILAWFGRAPVISENTIALVQEGVGCLEWPIVPEHVKPDAPFVATE